MAKHQAPETTTSRVRRVITRYVWHPAVHIGALVILHIIALGVLETTHLTAFVTATH